MAVKRARRHKDASKYPPVFLYLGLVRAIGTSTKPVVESLTTILKPYKVDVVPIKLSTILKQLAPFFPSVINEDIQPGSYEYKRQLMELGDHVRNTEALGAGFLAQQAVRNARQIRAKHEKRGTRRTAFVFDSLMNEVEVEVLREVYGDRFFLIGITENSDSRQQKIMADFKAAELERLKKKDSDNLPRSAYYNKKFKDDARRLMAREESGPDWVPEPCGCEACSVSQIGRKARVRIAYVFERADVFIDTTNQHEERREYPGRFEKRDMTTLGRFIQSVFGANDITPTVDEMGMSYAQTAALSSGCLARRVGAAIVDERAFLLATGSNEVPRFGGGQYWPPYDSWYEQTNIEASPMRDLEFPLGPPRGELWDSLPQSTEGIGGDPNEREKAAILIDGIQRVQRFLERKVKERGLSLDFNELMVIPEMLNDADILEGRAMDVIEYTRTVHAEMHAIASCLIRGQTTEGATLYTTTFPCHECARFIVAAGIKRVVFVEAYPKSIVSYLHSDSVFVRLAAGIDDVLRKEVGSDGSSNRLLIEPFVGVAPRRLEQLNSWRKRKQKIRDDLESIGVSINWTQGPKIQLRVDEDLSVLGFKVAYAAIGAAEEACIVAADEGLGKMAGASQGEV